MVRETSQWEREEMEKVVSERKHRRCVRLGERWLYLSKGRQVLCSIIVYLSLSNSSQIQGGALKASGSGWSVAE